ncbi:MAG: type VI secretion system baseplate subunit TssG [Nitrospirae bacterium]|nr:type VI secretion system baseplate subunit TssG [Nitrospirota bacterium]
MAGTPGNANIDLEILRNDLGKNASEFQFFQAVRLLRLLRPSVDGENVDEELWRQVMIRPTLSLAFPPNDIEVLEWEGPAGKPVLDVNFFGLYGVASPLPTFYTEDLIDEKNEDGSAARDFLDILHGRLYPLLYEAWEKNRISLRAYEKGEKDIENLFHVFTGLSLPVFREADPLASTALRYAGILTQHPRSAKGLEAILSDALGGVPVEVRQCVERDVAIPEEQRLALGRHLSLGEETVLGDRVRNRTNQVLIRIGPINNDVFETLLPGRENLRKVAFWKEFYLLDPLLAEVEILLSDTDPRPTCLGGDSRNRLGLDAWLEYGSFTPEKSVFIGVESVLSSGG